MLPAQPADAWRSFKTAIDPASLVDIVNDAKAYHAQPLSGIRYDINLPLSFSISSEMLLA